MNADSHQRMQNSINNRSSATSSGLGLKQKILIEGPGSGPGPVEIEVVTVEPVSGSKTGELPNVSNERSYFEIVNGS